MQLAPDERHRGLIHFTPDLVDEEGNVTKPDTQQFLHDYMIAFEQFIARVYTAIPKSVG